MTFMDYKRLQESEKFSLVLEYKWNIFNSMPQIGEGIIGMDSNSQSIKADKRLLVGKWELYWVIGNSDHFNCIFKTFLVSYLI